MDEDSKCVKGEDVDWKKMCKGRRCAKEENGKCAECIGAKEEKMCEEIDAWDSGCVRMRICAQVYMQL